MITLYDFGGKIKHPWNVSVWKARYSLNFKSVAYKTIWIEYPDIEPTMKELGALPTGRKPDGSPLYTLPVIHDDSTGAIIADSALIAEYLDKTYPTPTQLIPTGTHALQAVFREMVSSKAITFATLVLPEAMGKVVNQPSAEYLEHAYSALVLEAKTADEEERVAKWEKAKEFLGGVDALMKREDKWIMGDAISFADFVVAAVLTMVKNIFGKESEAWKQVVSWHEGRWDRMMIELEKYSTVY
ncbi:hypothetical protein BDP27DRAFT_1299913 [Rhodocollybia butyracea]|uniref:GST N-terminal domain-containing protein n=1 Tax=Rhodocollybia butyracea TaxID=206335 RepID=A0A9P5PJA6_9AGAR|nr:hypothetical protein BDP27DRAFT_1299913 [Rhodocollybia butyracea]